MKGAYYMKRFVANIVLDGAIGSYDKLYSYFVPEIYKIQLKLGMRVTVPFGSGNIKKQGIVLSLRQEENEENLKEILGVIDNEPVLNDEMTELCHFMKERLFCTYFDAIHTILPTGLNCRMEEFYCVNEEFTVADSLTETEKDVFDIIKAKGTVSAKTLKANNKSIEDVLLSLKLKEAVYVNLEPKRKVLDKMAKYVKIADGITDFSFLSDRQREVVELLSGIGAATVKEVEYYTGVSSSVINTLRNKGVLEVFSKQVYRKPYSITTRKDDTPINLNEEQQKAFVSLKNDFLSGMPKTSLLYGVTGSGKTSVYMKLVDEAAKLNKGVIVMVPEIALTPQMINLFSNRYADKIAVFHSGMSIGERLDEYNRVKKGLANIVIGTRSAIFAPLKDIGLIIMDEEQEHTYKSEKNPRYNARDIAKFRANYHKCLLLLSSATPSLESYSLAISGRYGLSEINNRYGEAKLPKVTVVDMRKEIFEGNTSNISRTLAEKIEERLKNNKQVILLLNRRGHNTQVSCPSCGYVAVCDECSVSLTYHSANNRLMCHYCGKSVPLYKKCPECGSEHLCFHGAGTQKLEEELKSLFCDAKILRMDADTTMSKDSYSENLKAFSNKEYDIMIGTQMVAKGLDFKDVDLVGVIGADRAFYSDDYRGFERTFSLLTQVIGRAGRAGGEAEAVIQTQNTEDDVISLASKQDYVSFYNEEILTRKLMIYPPFCDICMLVVSSGDKDNAQNTVNEIFERLKTGTKGEFEDIKMIILGPSPASVVKVNGNYRYRMIIKCKNSKHFRDYIRECIKVKLKKGTYVFIDINPETVI